MSALSSVVGLIPLTIASGLAMKVSKSTLPNGKTKKAQKMERKMQKKKVSRKVKRVTKSRSSSRNQLDKWLG